MDQEAINRDLRQKDCQSSVFQKKLLAECKKYLKASSDKMSTYWEVWDKNEHLYRGYRLQDRQDKESERKGEPVKIVVPIVYAQLQTYLSFVLSTFNQREYFFELMGRGPEDQRYKEGLEIDLQYQIEKQSFIFKLYNWLLQSGKYGFGTVKVQWVEEYERVRTTRTQPANMLSGLVNKIMGNGSNPMTVIETTQDLLAYQGNEILNISPYCFFPDPDISLACFQDGAFVFHEEEVTPSKVKSKEGKDYHGTDKIPEHIPTDLEGYRQRRAVNENEFDPVETGTIKRTRPFIMSEGIITIIPADWSEKDGIDIDLGKGREPVKFQVVIGNDSKIVQFKPYGYLHNKFGYSIVEYSPDSDAFINPGLTDTVYELQNLMTWFLNAHVANVKRAIKNRFIGNAEKIFTEDLEGDSALIRTRMVQDVGKVLKQVNVTDVTANHVRDMEVLNKLLQLVTGINENAVGQYAQGRRSAYESKQVNAGAAARLKMHAILNYVQGIEPLGKMMLANTRQGRAKEVYEMIVGEKMVDCPFEMTILTPPNKIIGGYDFAPYDATLPSDRINQANIFKELLTGLLSGPEAVLLMRKDPAKILNHILGLLGVRNAKDFDLVQQQIGNGIQAQVAGPEQMAQMAGSGQLAGASALDMLSGL